MANKNFSQLPAITSIESDSVIAVDSNTTGVTEKMTIAELKTEIGGGTISRLFQGVDTTGDMLITTTEQVIPLDFESIKDDYYTHSTSTNPGEVTFNVAGWYKITAMTTISTRSASGGIRGNPVLHIQLDTGSGFVTQPDNMGGYIREDGTHRLSTSVTGVGLFQFAVGDKIRLVVHDTTTTPPDEATEPYSSRMILEFKDRSGNGMNGDLDQLTDIGDVNAYAPTDEQVLTYDAATAKWVAADTTAADVKQHYHANFQLIEDKSNTTAPFYAFRASGTDNSDGKKSVNPFNQGLNNAGSVSPYFVPEDVVIREVSLSVKGCGVQNGSVAGIVNYRIELFDTQWTTNVSLGVIDIPIDTTTYTVATFGYGNTNAYIHEHIPVQISIPHGTKLGVLFDGQTGTSDRVAYSRNAFLTIELEEE